MAVHHDSIGFTIFTPASLASQATLAARGCFEPAMDAMKEHRQIKRYLKTCSWTSRLGINELGATRWRLKMSDLRLVSISDLRELSKTLRNLLNWHVTMRHVLKTQVDPRLTMLTLL
jgi:hypothetical protein